jgi:16S rRNA (cytosine967-C5)-methyltransferase
MGLKPNIAQRLTAPGLIARAMALELLESVLENRLPFDEAWAQHRGLKRLDEKDRGFVRHLCATTLRRLGQIDALIDHCLDKPIQKRALDIRYFLQIGVTQILFLKTPPHAAVDTTVNLADYYGFKPLKGFVNAVLRRITKEGDALLAAQDAERLNTPNWLWQSLSSAYGEAIARQIAQAHLNEPPLDITVKENPDTWATTLEGTVLPTGSVRRTHAGTITTLPGFDDGSWWVQDTAAALPAHLLGNVQGQSVIDLCAAPGGKTAQLALGGASVIALDRSAGRLKILRENLRRLSLSAEVIQGDARSWQPAEPVDSVLIDAPCSATGTIRRHPDISWLKSIEDVETLALRQQELLSAAATMVRPGGTIVFCTCSLQAEEGPAQITAFLDQHRGFMRNQITKDEVFGLQDTLTELGELRTLPHHMAEHGGMDGFFAARLVRNR